MVKAFYSQLAQLLTTGESVAVATVVATRGSTPREIGAKMLVRRCGSIVGTIGGGCGEAQVWRSAFQVLETGRPVVEFVDLTEEISLDSAAVCGGTMDVLVERWNADHAGGSSGLALARALEESLNKREPVILATVVAAAPQCLCTPGQRALLSQEGLVMGGLGTQALNEALEAAAPAIWGEEAPGVDTIELRLDENTETHQVVRMFLQVVQAPPRLVIVGGGHIAIPLSRMAKLMDFDVTILDDRGLFANKERFPEADAVLTAEFSQGIRELQIDRSSYVVLITRGHQHDVECLRELVGREFAYLGMIGSKRRVRAVFELLGQQGIAPDRLAHVHAPIGLDIGAKTPAEIALSILAEVVKVRRGGRAESLSANGRRAE